MPHRYLLKSQTQADRTRMYQLRQNMNIETIETIAYYTVAGAGTRLHNSQGLAFNFPPEEEYPTRHVLQYWLSQHRTATLRTRTTTTSQSRYLRICTCQMVVFSSAVGQRGVDTKW